jgi:hypothetical protein
VVKQSRYGEIIEVQNILVRWNSRYRAFNLLVTRGTTVIPADAGKLPHAGENAEK